MNHILQYRQMIINYYKQFEKPFNFYLRFFAGLFIFIKMGFLSQGNLSFSKIIIVGVCCGLLTAVVPITVFYFLLMAVGGFYMSFASIELALMVMIIIFLIIAFYSRLFPVCSLVIPFIIIAYHFNIPYVVPIFAGVYIGIIGIIPVVIGTFLWGLIPYLSEITKLAPRSAFSPLGMPDSFVRIYVLLTDILSNNTQWISEMTIFVFVVVIVCIVAHSSINFSKEIAIIVGGSIMILAFTIGIILNFIDYNMLFMIIGVIVSVAIVFTIKFFESVLDYPNSERVQFEDDNNYYYVKVVPKMIVDVESVRKTRQRKMPFNESKISFRQDIDNNDIEDE